jgi:hypothetical protein
MYISKTINIKMKIVLELNLSVTNMGEYNRVLLEINDVEDLPHLAESKLYKDKIEEVSRFALSYYHSRVVWNGYGKYSVAQHRGFSFSELIVRKFLKKASSYKT